LKFLTTLVLVFFFIGCSATFPPAGISKSYKHVGARVISPNESGWYLMKHSDPSVVFSKKYSNSSESAVANTYLIWIGEFESDKAFFDAIKAGRNDNDDKSRFKQLEQHYESLTYKGRPCVKFKGISEDHGNAGIDSKSFQYFKNIGYICRTNLNQTTALLMEVSHRSNSRELPQALRETASSFFNSIELTRY